MTEKAIRFGKNKSLVGILTLPEKEKMKPDQPAVIILNSGLLHRIGPNRVYVRIARELAAAGLVAFRFDFSGIGDSKKSDTQLGYEERSIAETQAAMDFLGRTRDVQRFILTGICSGADISFQTARKDERVTGIAPIDFYSLPSTGYLMYAYKKRLVSPRSWVNLFSGKSEVVGLFKKVFNNLTLLKTATASDKTDTDAQNDLEADLAAGFFELTERQLKLKFIYSEGSPAYYNYRNLFQKKVADLKAAEKFSIDYFDTADHGFTLQYHQQQLVSALKDWAVGCV